MGSRRLTLFTTAGLTLIHAPTVRAGMASPLPNDPELVLQLSEPAVVRLQNISFFLAGFLLCVAVVWGLWNWLRRDVPKLPRLSFGKALVAVVLWGLLFVIVLSMITGARELMTPGAWQKQGFTYRLSDEVVQASELAARAYRRQHLERLRASLWQFAATHEGRFPSAAETERIPADQWEVPDAAGLRYLYVAGLSAVGPKAVLAYEPELDAHHRFVLWTDGELSDLRSAEVERLTGRGGGP